MFCHGNPPALKTLLSQDPAEDAEGFTVTPTETSPKHSPAFAKAGLLSATDRVRHRAISLARPGLGWRWRANPLHKAHASYAMGLVLLA